MSTKKIKAKRIRWNGEFAWALPNTAEAYDQMVEIIAYEVQSGDAIGRPWIDTARNIMSRLNITRPKEGKK